MTTTIESYTSIISNKSTRNHSEHDDNILYRSNKEINLNEAIDKLNYDININNSDNDE